MAEPVDHAFTKRIRDILHARFGDAGRAVFAKSELLQYLNLKTRSASRGSKSRGAFANHYALYVLTEDYVKHGYTKRDDYGKYEGARFSDLFTRQRELPFGSKLQNHALNHRLNEEFRKFFPGCEFVPILRDAETNRYWINENLFRVDAGATVVNIAETIVEVIDAYVEAKRDAFENFIHACEDMQSVRESDGQVIFDFVAGLLSPNADARIFEIASFGILKAYYGERFIYWGWSLDEIQEEHLVLFKTGRTNANDGGIDFVMRPLGRFFQVTETLDVRKYFLDIDKVQHYPITFVVKTSDTEASVRDEIRRQAGRSYGVTAIVARYMECVEEIINIPSLLERLAEVFKTGKVNAVLDEIIRQSKVEFNYVDDEPEAD